MTCNGNVLTKRIELLNRINRPDGKAISNNLDLYTASAALKIVDKWVEIGLVVKERIGRKVVLSLTDRGKRYLDTFNSVKHIADFLDG